MYTNNVNNFTHSPGGNRLIKEATAPMEIFSCALHCIFAFLRSKNMVRRIRFLERHPPIRPPVSDHLRFRLFVTGEEREKGLLLHVYLASPSSRCPAFHVCRPLTIPHFGLDTPQPAKNLLEPPGGVFVVVVDLQWLLLVFMAKKRLVLLLIKISFSNWIHLHIYYGAPGKKRK